MSKIEEKKRIMHIKGYAVIERPMVLVPVEEYEELLEDAEAAKSKSLTREIEEARERFNKGLGRSLTNVVNEIENRKA